MPSRSPPPRKSSNAPLCQASTADGVDQRKTFIGSLLLSPEAYRMISLYLFFATVATCLVITKLTGTAPADFTKTELYRAFGYVNDCVWLDYPPASNVAPTMWACFLFPWMAYALTWQARLASKVEPYGPVRVITQRVFQVCTVYEVFAGVHFIQCFCNKPWDSPFPLGLKMHTYPFTMFIFALWVSSMKNAYWFYNFGNGSANTKRAIALFELLYVPLAFGKILIEVNFFLDSYFFVSGNPQAAQIGVVLDKVWVLFTLIILPGATYYSQYRIGGRVSVHVYSWDVVEGDFDLMGRAVGKKVTPATVHAATIP